MRKVAMIGSGWIAPKHIRAFQANGVEVCAMLSADPAAARRVCEETGIAPRMHESIETLLAEKCDFFDVLVPPQLQSSFVEKLAPRGKPLLCEKPLALSVAEARAMIDVCERNGVRLMVMHNQLFFGPHVRARELIAAGEIGEPKLVRLHLVGSHSATSGWKRALGAKGGLIWDDCMHRLYTAQHLMGSIVSVRGTRTKLFGRDDLGLAGSVHLTFEQDRMGVMDFSYGLGGAGFYDDSLTVIGTEGVVQINGAYGTPWPLPRMNVRTHGAWRTEPVDDSWEASFKGLVAHFLECLSLGTGSQLIGGQAALQTVRMAEAIQESFISDHEVTLFPT